VSAGPVDGAPAPTEAATTPTTEAPGCDGDLVDELGDLIQDQLDALGDLSVSEVVSGAADTAAFREREARLTAGLAADGCSAAEVRALLADDARDFEAEGEAAERYLAIVLDAIGVPAEP
jgi:hypothetical protein